MYDMQTLGEGGGLNQAYSRLSTPHGHITDCKLDSVVYAGGPNDLHPISFGMVMAGTSGTEVG